MFSVTFIAIVDISAASQSYWVDSIVYVTEHKFCCLWKGLELDAVTLV